MSPRLSPISAAANGDRAPGLTAKIRVTATGAVGDGFLNPVLPVTPPLHGCCGGRLMSEGSNLVLLGDNKVGEERVSVAIPKSSRGEGGTALQPGSRDRCGTAIAGSGGSTFIADETTWHASAGGVAISVAGNASRKRSEILRRNFEPAGLGVRRWSGR